MKRMVILLTMIMLVAAGCGKVCDNRSFEVYSIESTYSTDAEAVVYKKLLFDETDIEYYDWENQRIGLSSDCMGRHIVDVITVDEYFENEKINVMDDGGSDIFGTCGCDMFAVVFDEEVVYIGDFKQPAFSSHYPLGAVLLDSEDGVVISHNGIDLDYRFDEQIYEYLENKDLLL